jgi:hypothetical protein
MHIGVVAVAIVGPHESLVEPVGGSGDGLRLASRLARVPSVVMEFVDATTPSTAIVNSFLVGRVDAVLDSRLGRVYGVGEVPEQVSENPERATRLFPVP